MRGKFLSVVFLFVFSLVGWRAAAQSPDPAVIKTSDAYQLLRPLELDQERVRHDFPSLEGIDWSDDESSALLPILRHLEGEGIPIAIGAEANSQSIFELYLPIISVALGLPPLTILGENSEGGGEYFKYHDGLHLFAGIPGPRLSDLDDIESSKKKWIDVMLRKEHVATTWSFMIFLKEYWNWRHEVYGNDRGEGDRYTELNQGVYNIGRMGRETYVDMLGHSIQGEPWSYFKKLIKVFDPQFIREADEQGVPVPLPRLKVPGELHLLKWMVAVVEPLMAYYRSAGYKGFLAYSEVTVDYMLQEWYVRWADRFDFGMPLAEIDQHIGESLSKLKRGELLGRKTPVKNGEFDLSFLRNEVALLARRLAEFRAFSKEQRLLDSETQNVADEYYEALATLHDEITQYRDGRETYESAVIDSFRMKTRMSLLQIEAEFDMEEIVRFDLRIPFVDYRQFWRNPNAVLYPRQMENAGGYSPAVIREFRRAEKSFMRNRFTRTLYKRLGRFMFLDVNRIVMSQNYFLFRRALSRNYDRSQNALREPKWEANDVIGQALEVLDFQLNQVVLPQVVEAEHLSADERSGLITDLSSEWELMRSQIQELASSQDVEFQERVLRSIQTGLLRTRDILISLRRKKSFMKAGRSGASSKRYRQPMQTSFQGRLLESLRVDFIHLEQDPHARVLRPYLSMAHWIDGSVLENCGAIMLRLRRLKGI